MVTITEFLNLTLLGVLLIVFIYIAYVQTIENKLFEECNFKILCEKGYLESNVECQTYLSQKQNVLNVTDYGRLPE